MNRQIKADEGKGMRVPPQDTRPHKAYSPGDASRCHAYLTHDGATNGTLLCPILSLFYTHALAHGAQQRGQDNGTRILLRIRQEQVSRGRWQALAVSGMREARKLCKDLNAQPWNF